MLTFSNGGSGTVTLTNTAALGAAGNTIRFSGGGSGILDLQTDTSVNAYGIASGTFNGATITVNRATSGAGITHVLGTLELSSVTLTANTGGNVTSGSAGVSFTELKMSGGNDFNPVTLAGSATYTLGSASITSNGFAKRLQLDGTSNANTVTGIISDTNNSTAGAVVHLIKANTGTWTLGGNNTYTGDTTIKAGTLKLGASGGIGNSPNIIVGDTGSSGAVLDTTAQAGFTVGTGQTLKGIGTVNVGSANTLTVNGTHSPGTSPGVQSVIGGLTYGANAIFNWELTANTSAQGGSPDFTFDQVNLTGALTITSGATINILLNAPGSTVDFSDAFWNYDQSWDIFTGASGVSGNFVIHTITGDMDGMLSGSEHPNGQFTINGSTLHWTAVPEASNVLIGCLLTLGMLRRRRGIARA